MRLGVIGGGQLGRMLALAAHPLGIRVTTLDPATDSPAAQVAPSITGGYEDPDALDRLVKESDVVTYEFENVPVASASAIAERVPVRPPPAALEAAQDRLAEKTLFERVGLGVPPYAPVEDLAGLDAALGRVGVPAVLKARRLGYDGKGQAVVRDPVLAEDAWRAIGEVPSILEALVAFDSEVSILGVRGLDGETVFYPLVENHHRDGILRRSVAPAPGVPDQVQREAEEHARAIMAELSYVGVLAIELFRVDERLLANEMAPRVHNSGHWTIEGAETSQFENHLRAVCGLPVGPTAAVGHCEMVNLIGGTPRLDDLAGVPGAHVHLYGKAPRPGRKLGHVTIQTGDPDVTRARSLQVTRLADENST